MPNFFITFIIHAAGSGGGLPVGSNFGMYPHLSLIAIVALGLIVFSIIFGLIFRRA